jgi:hypothetical protein
VIADPRGQGGGPVRPAGRRAGHYPARRVPRLPRSGGCPGPALLCAADRRRLSQRTGTRRRRPQWPARGSGPAVTRCCLPSARRSPAVPVGR